MAQELATTDQQSRKLAISSTNITLGRATCLPIEAETALTFESSLGVTPQRRAALLADEGIADPAALEAAIAASLEPSAYTWRKAVLAALYDRMPKQDGNSETKPGSWLLSAVRLLEDIPQDILQFAMDEAERTKVFLPGVAELRAIAEPLLRKRRLCLARVREIQNPPAAQRDELPTYTDDDRKSIAEIAKQTIARLETADRDMQPKARGDRRPIPNKHDEADYRKFMEDNKLGGRSPADRMTHREAGE